jgi:hypothetical protein
MNILPEFLGTKNYVVSFCYVTVVQYEDVDYLDRLNASISKK